MAKSKKDAPNVEDSTERVDDAGAVDASDATSSDATAAPEVTHDPAPKIVFGMTPNPSLADLNRAAVRQSKHRLDANYAAAQRMLARTFKRPV